MALLVELALSVGGANISHAMALPALAPGPSLLEAWSFVLFESSLLPHALPGGGVETWGAGPLVLTAILLASAFRHGRSRARSAADLALLALPAAAGATLITIAAAVAGGDRSWVARAPLAGLPIAGAAAAGMAWCRLRERRQAAPVLRALMSAMYALLVAAGLAAPAILLAPAPAAPPGGWLLALLPYAPNAVLRGALAGGSTADITGLALVTVAAVAVGTQLSRRSLVERAAYAAAVTALLTAAGVASTPATGTAAVLGQAWHMLPRALAAGILGALAGPHLGSAQWGHALGSTALLRTLGDRLPAPAAAEITDVRSISLPGVAPAPASRLSAGHRVGRIAVAAAAIAAVLMAAVVGVTVMSTGPPAAAASPELAVARAYLEAAGTADAPRAWEAVAIDTSSVPAVASSRLLSREAMARMFAVPAERPGRPRNLHLELAGRAGAAALVRARFDDASGAHDVTLSIGRLGASHRVLVTPAGVSLPASSVGSFAIDGTPVAGGPYPVVVLPGIHRVTARYPAPFLDQASLVVADQPYSHPAVAAVGARLDEAGMQAARQAVAGALRACMTASSSHPTGCPQAVEAPAGVSVRWAIVGDPAQSLVALPDDRGGVVAHGQFEAVAAYDVHVPEDVKHVAAGGAFRVPLAWSGTDWSVAGAVDADAADVARPAAPDSEILPAVRAGFARCEASTLLRPADCPQAAPSQLYVRDVSWRLLADPMAGAATGFDARHGILQVTGRYAMAATYVEGGAPRSATSSGGYRADLFWDGRRLTLVAINRTP